MRFNLSLLIQTTLVAIFGLEEKKTHKTMFSFSPNFIADIAPAAKKKSFKEPGIETQSTGKTNKGGKETLIESRKNLTCLTLCISNISVQLAQSLIKPTFQTQNLFYSIFRTTTAHTDHICQAPERLSFIVWGWLSDSLLQY